MPKLKAFNGLIHKRHTCSYCKIEHNIYQRLKFFAKRETRKQARKNLFNKNKGKLTKRQLVMRKLGLYGKSLKQKDLKTIDNELTMEVDSKSRNPGNIPIHIGRMMRREERIFETPKPRLIRPEFKRRL